jgi:hypothetical protein
MSNTTPHALAALTTPDEDPGELEALIEALRAELDPRTHLERRQVELIAHTEWEITRHRRQSAQLLAAEADRVRSHVAKEEANRHLLSSHRHPNAPPPEPPSPERAGEFAALAYVRHFQFHAHHELSTERLEARRRQLLRDYQEMQARRERATASDAEIINE